MADSPFGAYRGGYQAMPQGWLQAAMQPGMNYAEGIQGLASGVVSGLEKYAANKEKGEGLDSSIPSQYNMYQQTAQAAGVEIDPTLAERYSGLGQMSLPQKEAFSRDLMAGQQNAITLANIQRQQALFDLQRQSAARAAQNQALAARRASILGFFGGVPPAQPSMSQGAAMTPPSRSFAPNPPLYNFNGQDASGLTVMPGTISGIGG